MIHDLFAVLTDLGFVFELHPLDLNRFRVRPRPLRDSPVDMILTRYKEDIAEHLRSGRPSLIDPFALGTSPYDPQIIGLEAARHSSEEAQEHLIGCLTRFALTGLPRALPGALDWVRAKFLIEHWASTGVTPSSDVAIQIAQLFVTPTIVVATEPALNADVSFAVGVAQSHVLPEGVAAHPVLATAQVARRIDGIKLPANGA